MISSIFHRYAIAVLAAIGIYSTALAQSGRDPESIVIHELSEPETLNPITATDVTAQDIHALIFEPLLTADPETLETVPWLVVSLPKISDDGMTYEYTLRGNARFSDGIPVTGEDIIFALKAFKDRFVVNAEPIRNYYKSIDRVELVNGDPRHIRIHLNAPNPLADQVTGGILALPKHIWDPRGYSDRISWPDLSAPASRNKALRQLADEIMTPERGRTAAALIGSGPYRLEDWRAGGDISLRKVENYWNAAARFGTVHAKRLIFRVVADPRLALDELRAGRIDVVPIADKPAFFELEESLTQKGIVPIMYRYPSYTYVGYNCRDPRFADPRVRKALAYALDRGSMIRTIYRGTADLVESPILAERPECDTTIASIPFDLDSARLLLDAAGWKDRDGDGIREKTINGTIVRLEFTIMLNFGNQRRAAIAETFVHDLGTIGVAATTATLDWAVFLDRTRKGEFEAFIGGWANSAQESSLRQIWHSSSIGGGSNYVGYRNRTVDSLIDRLDHEGDFERRIPLYRQIQRIIYDDQPYNFLLRERLIGAYSGRFTNVHAYSSRPCLLPQYWMLKEGK